MKIPLKIPPETLFLIHRLVLDRAEKISIFEPAKKIQKSMLIEIFQILVKSCANYSSNPNGKPRKLTLRYHLAHQLYETILEVINHPSLGIYERTKLDQLKNDLHRKLL